MSYGEAKVYFDGSHYIAIPQQNRPIYPKKVKNVFKEEQELIAEIENNPLTVIHKNDLKRATLKSQKEKLDRALFDAQKQLTDLRKANENLTNFCSNYTQAEAEQKVEELSTKLRSLNDKQNHTKIPEQIERLRSEIKLLHSTIADLMKRQSEIQGTA